MDNPKGLVARILEESASEDFLREQSETALLRIATASPDEGDVGSQLQLIRLRVMHETRAFSSMLSDADLKAAEELSEEAFRSKSSLAAPEGCHRLLHLSIVTYFTGELSFALHWR